MNDFRWLVDGNYLGTVRWQLILTGAIFALTVAATVFLVVRTVGKRGKDAGR